jgi:hypothetical protein
MPAWGGGLSVRVPGSLEGHRWGRRQQRQQACTQRATPRSARLSLLGYIARRSGGGGESTDTDARGRFSLSTRLYQYSEQCSCSGEPVLGCCHVLSLVVPEYVFGRCMSTVTRGNTYSGARSDNLHIDEREGFMFFLWFLWGGL